MSVRRSTVPCMVEGPLVPRGYRHEWALFDDWCAAAECSALPSEAATLALFLGENPAGAVAQRRRVTAVNHAHRSRGYPQPGTVTAIRLQLDHVRSARAAVRRNAAAPVIAALPVSGWPTGMFGRRDAVILALYAGGLRPVDVSALNRREVSVDGTALSIGGNHHLHLADNATDSAAAAPVAFTAVWRRWAQVLDVIDRYPSTRALEQFLRTGTCPGSGSDAAARPGGSGPGPVVMPIDRWGAVPLPPMAMTAAAVAQVIAAHLTGTAPRHQQLPAPTGRSPGVDAGVAHSLTSESTRAVVVLPDTHTDGVAARAAAHTALADIGEVFDDIEDRAEELLRRTLALLDGA